MADKSRITPLQAQQLAQASAGTGGAASAQGGQTAEQIEQQRRKQEAEQEQRRLMLNQIMTPEAREKVANIRLVKPERAAQVESMVISAAQSGQLSGRVTETQLKELLQTVIEQTQKKTSVTIMRRRRAFEEDDDDDDDDDW